MTILTNDLSRTRTGRAMHTATGKPYWPLDPRAEDVELETIARHLATRCRYNGAVRHPKTGAMFYSVAEHSVYVAYDVAKAGGSKLEILCALLHDASEAYNGDLIRPLKYDPLFAQPFKVVEERNEQVICERFTLPYPFPKIVKQADEAVTAAEIQQIVPRDNSWAWDAAKMHSDERVADIEVLMLDPKPSYEVFMAAHEAIYTQELSLIPHALEVVLRLANNIKTLYADLNSGRLSHGR